MKKIIYYQVYNDSIFGAQDDLSTRDFLFNDENEARKCVYHLNAALDSGVYTYRELSLTIYDSVAELDDARVASNPMNHRILDYMPRENNANTFYSSTEDECEGEY